MCVRMYVRLVCAEILRNNIKRINSVYTSEEIEANVYRLPPLPFPPRVRRVNYAIYSVDLTLSPSIVERAILHFTVANDIRSDSCSTMASQITLNAITIL